MKLIFINLFVIILGVQQVALAIQDELLEPFFNSLDWKQSLAFDAPVISHEETLKHLKNLVKLLPKDKNEYIRGEDRSASADEPANEDDWDRNDNYGLMRHRLDKLIEFANIDQNSCDGVHFQYLYAIDQHENNLAHPDKLMPFGENIEAYLNYHRTKVLGLCRDEMKKSLSNIPSDQLAMVKNLAQKVKGSGIEPALVDHAANDGSLANVIGDFIKNESNTIKGRNLKHKFSTLVEACTNTFNKMYPRGFYDSALNKPVVSAYIHQDEFLSEWALIINMCKAINGKVKLSDIKQ